MSIGSIHISLSRLGTQLRVLALVMLCLAPFAVRSQITPAYQVKAAFIYNFTQFMEWPPQAYDDQLGPFVIGILGENPFGNYLDELVKGEKVAGRRIVVRKFKELDEIKYCNILFINVPHAREAARSLRNKSILTISEENNFAREGGMVRFFTANNKIRFQINPAAARGAGISISAKLLRVADIVER